MNSSTITRISAPDQTAKARQVISLMLALDPEARSGILARLIAASLHQGSGTALHRFAATGALNLERARDELNWLDLDDEQEDWADALGRYFYLRDGLTEFEATTDTPDLGVLRGQTANDAE